MDPAIPQSLVPSPAEPVQAEFDLLCEGCGYSLIGLTDSSRCPECGKQFEPNDLPLARVPWLYRRRLGEFTAYWRTVGCILGDPTGFATELCRPVRISAADAAAFRRLTIRIAVISVMVSVIIVEALLLAYFLRRGWSLGHPYTQRFLIRAGVGVVVGYISIKVLFTLGTDLPTFIWRGISERNHELAPLHHYTSAPLALLPAFALVAGIAAVIESEGGASDDFYVASGCLAVAVIIETLMMGWLAAILMRSATGCSGRRQLGLISYLLGHWALIGILSLMFVAAVFSVLSYMLGPIFRW